MTKEYDNDLSHLVGKLVLVNGLHKIPIEHRSLNVENGRETWGLVSYYDYSCMSTPVLFVSYEKDPVFKVKHGAFLRKIRLLQESQILLLQFLPYPWQNIAECFEVVQ